MPSTAGVNLKLVITDEAHTSAKPSSAVIPNEASTRAKPANVVITSEASTRTKPANVVITSEARDLLFLLHDPKSHSSPSAIIFVEGRCKLSAAVRASSSPRKTPTLPKLRISVVQYLNTAPLVWGFTHGLLEGKYDLSFTVPSQCAEQLRAGEVDVAIIPAIEYQRIDDLVILPDLAIASKRRVRSLLLISKVPIAPVPSSQAGATQRGPRSIALDRSSRSTQALTKILCARHWQIAPQFQEMAPDLPAMLVAHDAALLIGDPALRLSLAIESAQSSNPSPSDRLASTTRLGSAGLLRAAGSDAKSVPAGFFSSTPTRSQFDRSAENPPQPPNSHSIPSASASNSAASEICNAKTLGISGTDQLYVYDIVSEWRAMTGLSAVLAVWAARPAVATPEVVADFHASRAFGLLHLPELCADAAAQLQLPAPALHSYLTDNIDFTLDPENVAALTRFFVEAHALDLTPASKPVLLAPGPESVTLEPVFSKPR